MKISKVQVKINKNLKAIGLSKKQHFIKDFHITVHKRPGYSDFSIFQNLLENLFKMQILSHFSTPSPNSDSVLKWRPKIYINRVNLMKMIKTILREIVQLNTGWGKNQTFLY